MTKDEKQWLSDVAALGCVACRNAGHGESPSEIHHIRSGHGMGQRASNYEVIPLCPAHHRLGGYGVAFHAAPRAWQKNYGTELELLEQTKRDVDSYRNSIVGRVA